MGIDEGDLGRSERKRDTDRELDDFNAELSGTKAGYIYTTGAAADDSRPDIRANKARNAEAQLSALGALLASDPEYRALYEDTQNKINDAGTRAETALAEAEAVLAKAEQDLSELEENAARTPDGRLAFKGGDGRVYDQDGNAIEGVQADSIVWSDETPAYEEYAAKKQTVTEARERVEAWQQYLLLIGEARDRVNDPDNPPSKDELREIQEAMEERNPAARMVEPEGQIPSTDTEHEISAKTQILKF